MNYLYVIVKLFLLLALVFVGCGDDEDEVVEEKKTVKTTTKKSGKKPIVTTKYNPSKSTGSKSTENTSNTKSEGVDCYELDRRHEQCSEDYVNGKRRGHHGCLVMHERYLDCCVTKTKSC